MNKAIKKVLDEHLELRKPFAELKVGLRTEKHFDVLGDLMEFTGLDEDEVVFRVLKKNPSHMETKGRGWFWDEWKWHDPASSREIDWFYMCSQSYLFSNARKTFWEPLDEFLNPRKHQTVLDYGSGVGTNVLGLLERGFQQVAFYDIGVLQQRFLEFRVRKRKLYPSRAHPVGDVWSGKHMLQGFPGFYDAIILHDVLEHVPAYEKLLGKLINLLRPGGVIVERSAFRNEGSERLAKKLPFHLIEKVKLKNAMVGMKLIGGHKDTARCWRKC